MDAQDIGLFGMDPQTVGKIGLGMQGIGSIMSVIGAFGAAQAQRSSLRYQADIDRVNQTIAEASARGALLAGQREQQRSMLATSQLKATQEASMAANGIDLGEGTAARIRTSTDVMGQIDVNTIAANALKQAWGYRTQATNFGNDAIQKSTAADAVSPWMAAASSLLTGAGRVASTWYELSRVGATPKGS